MSSVAVLAVSAPQRLAQCDRRDSRSRPWVSIQFVSRTTRLVRLRCRRCDCEIRCPQMEIAMCASIRQSISTSSSAKRLAFRSSGIHAEDAAFLLNV